MQHVTDRKALGQGAGKLRQRLHEPFLVGHLAAFFPVPPPFKIMFACGPGSDQGPMSPAPQAESPPLPPASVLGGAGPDRTGRLAGTGDIRFAGEADRYLAAVVSQASAAVTGNPRHHRR